MVPHALWAFHAIVNSTPVKNCRRDILQFVTGDILCWLWNSYTFVTRAWSFVWDKSCWMMQEIIKKYYIIWQMFWIMEKHGLLEYNTCSPITHILDMEIVLASTRAIVKTNTSQYMFLCSKSNHLMKKNKKDIFKWYVTLLSHGLFHFTDSHVHT